MRQEGMAHGGERGGRERLGDACYEMSGGLDVFCDFFEFLRPNCLLCGSASASRPLTPSKEKGER
jgi:hypothetical protein